MTDVLITGVNRGIGRARAIFAGQLAWNVDVYCSRGAIAAEQGGLTRELGMKGVSVDWY
jgi:NAD(P)-dependent dehydrogenase (short-subunit alcohol dehydrogenase family)